MSRGLGRIERGILNVLDEGRLRDPVEIAGIIYEVAFDAVTAAQAGAVRRALAGLQRKGLAFDIRRARFGRRLWGNRAEAIRWCVHLHRHFGDDSFIGSPRLRRLYAEATASGEARNMPPCPPTAGGRAGIEFTDGDVRG